MEEYIAATRDVNGRFTRIAADLVQFVNLEVGNKTQFIFTFTAQKDPKGVDITKISLETKNERD